MTSIDEITARRTEAFDAAEAVVREWRALGKHTTTAGVTSVLAHKGIIDLDAMGLASNREFWETAAASGVLGLAQQPNGHWLLLLPGELVDDLVVGVPTPGALALPDATADTELRLKSDVWASFVDWNPAYRRFWDRSHARAFMVPATGWVPDEIDAARFVEIEPALQNVQIDWMRAFADEWAEPDRTALLVSLADFAPRGAFRRELRARGLGGAWRTRLRECIYRTAVEWAAGAGIDANLLADARPRETAVALRTLTPPSRHDAPTPRTRSARATQPPTPVLGGRPISSERNAASEAHRVADGGTELLRARLHAVIDRMDWDDLIKVPLRAEHLIDI